MSRCARIDPKNLCPVEISQFERFQVQFLTEHCEGFPNTRDCSQDLLGLLGAEENLLKETGLPSVCTRPCVLSKKGDNLGYVLESVSSSDGPFSTYGETLRTHVVLVDFVTHLACDGQEARWPLDDSSIEMLLKLDQDLGCPPHRFLGIQDFDELRRGSS